MVDDRMTAMGIALARMEMSGSRMDLCMPVTMDMAMVVVTVVVVQASVTMHESIGGSLNREQQERS